MDDRDAYVAAARACAERLYLGDEVAHRSCGIALAVTFGLRHEPYQSLRRGGLLGLGPCGALQAGVLVLGELLGDPDPAGPPTPALREAVGRYRAELEASAGGSFDASCNERTAAFPQFASRPRLEHCATLAGAAAAGIAGVLHDLGRSVPIAVVPAERPGV